jgi:hypothetical protein
MRYFGAVTIDREVASPMREAKTGRKSHEERGEQSGGRRGDMASIDEDSHVWKCQLWLSLVYELMIICSII